MSLALWLQVLGAAAAPADDLFLPAAPAGVRLQGAAEESLPTDAFEYLGATVRRRHAVVDRALLDRARSASYGAKPRPG